MKLGEAVRSYSGLCKATISFFAAMSAMTGFLLADDPPGTTLPALFMGVFLMACGASSLNHYQERKSDSRMPRTAGRPIPAGKIKPMDALHFSVVLIGSGSTVLLSMGLFTPALLGLAAVFWYNGLYTWLKAHHAFAAIPGALAGAIPPAIGWTAGDGCISDIRLAAICFFFFMWQVPHFLLHQQAFGREYEAIRLPSLTALFTGAQLSRVTFQWLLAAAVSLQLVTLYGLIQSSWVQVSLLAASLWFVTRGTALIRSHVPGNPRIFMSTNHFMIVTMLLMFADRFSCCLEWVR